MSFSAWFYSPLDNTNHMILSLADATSANIIFVYATPTALLGGIVLDSGTAIIANVA